MLLSKIVARSVDASDLTVATCRDGSPISADLNAQSRGVVDGAPLVGAWILNARLSAWRREVVTLSRHSHIRPLDDAHGGVAVDPERASDRTPRCRNPFRRAKRFRHCGGHMGAAGGRDGFDVCGRHCVSLSCSNRATCSACS